MPDLSITVFTPRGMVLMGPHEAGQWGTLVLFADPQGAQSFLIQLREPQAWSE